MSWEAVTEALQRCDYEIEMQVSAPGTCLMVSGRDGHYCLSVPDWLCLWRLVGRFREGGMNVFSFVKLHRLLKASEITLSLVVKGRTRWTLG
ncbi:MAG: hypothetical protein HUJ26_22900 [Planctomycetaceae bacterium]|nr:hypothetical protein [Planctomycetaceae bacterium]